MLNPEGSLTGKHSQERKGWRVELRHEMKPCPGSRVVKSCYLVIFRLGRCKVTFTRKVSLRTGAIRAVAGGVPCSAGPDRSGTGISARGRSPPAPVVEHEFGDAAVWGCFSCDLHRVAKFTVCPLPSAPAAPWPRTIVAEGLQRENPKVK